MCLPVILLPSTVLNPLKVRKMATGYGQGNHLRHPIEEETDAT